MGILLKTNTVTKIYGQKIKERSFSNNQEDKISAGEVEADKETELKNPETYKAEDTTMPSTITHYFKLAENKK